ncbi:MAG: UDP-N-acetylmuramoyl-L-alanyl-D-glutamate--2,6-diaminopimelate ligase [Candidatus Shapirobacteria bacterium]
MDKKTYKIYFQKIKNILWHFPKSIFYNVYYGFPSRRLTLIGITGTDGKTTSVNLLHKTLLDAGIKAGIISTLGAKIGNESISVGLHTTSPDPAIVQKLLARMVKEGITHTVIEVTAHAIDQFRYYGCHFRISAITNTSHEHLDDFLDMESYIKTKAKLFFNSDIAILNKDDFSFSEIVTPATTKVFTYSIDKKSDYQAKDIDLNNKYLKFTVNKTVYKTDSNYRYQIYNILMVHSILEQLSVDSNYLSKIIIDFPEMKGRRELVKNDLHIQCIVDFAHTPNALYQTLSSLRLVTKGKLICLFGATGGRDQSKRPLMGKVVSQNCDIGIVTADDTRNEKIVDINKQIIAGFDQSKINSNLFTYYDIPNRQNAFNLAVSLAKAGDIIVACGKGHETSILHGKTEYPWSESDAYKTAFRTRDQNV